MQERSWLVLAFSLSRTQSSVRVSVWRKLKKCGAVTLCQSLWVLPDSPGHQQELSLISEEILDGGGTAHCARAGFIESRSDDEIVSLFNVARDCEYREFIDNCQEFFSEIDKETKNGNFTYIELEENEARYGRLSDWLERIVTRDFFSVASRSDAEAALDECRRLLTEFAASIYRENTEAGFGEER